MNSILIFLIVFLGFNFASDSFADENNKLLANFVRNLADHVEWKKKDNVNICFRGHDKISYYLESMPNEDSNIINRFYSIEKITIKDYVKLDDLSSCNILYIAKDQDGDLLKIINKLDGTKVITISLLNNFVSRGGIIEMQVMRRKVKLKLNEEALKETGVNISPVILLSVSPENYSSNKALGRYEEK